MFVVRVGSRKEFIRGMVNVGGKRHEAEMVWTCERRDSGHIGQKLLNMELPGRRRGGGLEVVKEDLQSVDPGGDA